jgi:peptidoglycan/LPS O-acetylase OafA/YrhL
MQSAAIIALGIIAVLILAHLFWQFAVDPLIEWALNRHAAHQVNRSHPEWFRDEI